MSSTERLHALFAEACLGVDASESFERDLRGYLAKHAVDAEDAAAILASKRRLGLYRRLVRHNIVNVIAAMLERTKARLEHHGAGAFDGSVDAFIAERGPRTPHLRDVPREFLTWAAPRWRDDARLPSWIADHAELELVDFTIGVAPRPAPPPPLVDVAADLPLVFAEPVAIVRLAYAVHALSVNDVAAEPDARASALLVYRDAEHQTRFLDLSPLAAAILERLLAGAPLAQAMVQAAQAEGHALDQAVLDGAARLLADLGERGVLLGARG
ncbi:hypothetical protein AKJ09_09697 [Labilithrix luteola]|uniref:Uncharacterized protein n=1 Tax=Labilithrix luteola TaxID=1391654 RepID=A0A0K1QBB2_9BACT|nr:putative DNA-binding domain-containing protein [Labilithrix luteola]AKV03034.1 hypothetical protein AKJ09_09697 [Labilithrix luteola]